MENSVYATYLIPQSRFETLEKAVNKLAKKVNSGKTAAEFPPEIESTRDVLMTINRGRRTFFDPSNELADADRITPFLWVTLKYSRPILNGWQLLAVYDWEITNDGTRTCYVSKVPNAYLLPDQHDVEDGRCDHCNTNRRRNKSMLITKDYIDFKVVGSTCIKDFLGHATPNSFIDCYSFEQSVERICNESYAGGDTVAYHQVSSLLAYSAYFTRTEGYVKAADVNSTSSRVYDQLFPSPQYTDIITPSEDDVLTAEYTAKWVLDQDSASDYINNLQKAITAGAISHKRMGVVISAVYAYQRACERAAADNGPKCNEHLGSIKERLKGLQAVVERIRYSEGNYGTTSIITLKSTQGHAIVWFASGYHDPAIGELWSLDGTVKKHDEFNGTCQTVLTRVKYNIAA